MNEKNKTKDIAVLLMLFARPETTRKVFESLRIAKPNKLFIAANGPRPDHPEDVAMCKAVRDIFNGIDWDCEVHTNYREVNIGLNPHWYQSMDWFFQFVEKGIILEDDCVPNLSFFDYCIELLEKYKDENTIMHINGSNFQFGIKRGNASYYFSRYPSVWGWATWSRAWNKYDNKIKSFPNFMENKVINTIIKNNKERKYWIKYFSGIYSGIYEDSAAKWLYAIWSNAGKCITPNVNMICNIGYGFKAENTFLKDKTLGQKTFNISKLLHPVDNLKNEEADRCVFKNVLYKTFSQKVIYVLTKKIIKLFGL